MAKKLIDNIEVENKEDFEIGGNSYNELLDLSQWLLENYKGKKFFEELLHSKYHFAHIIDNNADNQFNSSIWDETRWRLDSAKEIMTYLRTLGLSGVDISTHLAIEIARSISTSKSTLQVQFDTNWITKRLQRIVDNYGNYFDLKDGKIKKIDPAIHFQDNYDIPMKLEEGMGNPDIFIKFLKSRYGDSLEIVLDHFALGFVNWTETGIRPKSLWLVGGTRTYKSFTLDQIKKQLVLKIYLKFQ